MARPKTCTIADVALRLSVGKANAASAAKAGSPSISARSNPPPATQAASDTAAIPHAAVRPLGDHGEAPRRGHAGHVHTAVREAGGHTDHLVCVRLRRPWRSRTGELEAGVEQRGVHKVRPCDR